MERWARINYHPSIPLGNDGRMVTASDFHISIARKAAGEGMVLLKNDNHILPLKTGSKIALFGRGHIDYIKGGGGSGSVASPYTRSIYDGFCQKAEEGKVELFRELSDFYAGQLSEELTYLNALDRRVYIKERLENGKGSWEPEIPETLMAQAAEFADIAIFTVSRYSGEKYERLPGKGDFCLSEQEEALLSRLKARFRHIVVVLNIGGVSDVSWFSSDTAIEGALLAWQSGMEGGLAAADVLCGDVNPSGRLTDTFARCYEDYPSSVSFHESRDYENYYEDIFCGYRFFETIPGMQERVIYPFGYGLSYTDFTVSHEGTEKAGETLTSRFTVTNIGDCTGRQVVQLYGEAPRGKLEKAARVLCAFGKTALLAPGERETLTLSFPLDLLASYDDTGIVQKSAFLLEAGEYKLFAGENIRSTEPIFSFLQKQNKILKQASPRAVPTQLPYRLRADGTKEPLPKKEPAEDVVIPPELPKVPVEEGSTLFDVAEGKLSLDGFVASLPDEVLASLLYGHSTVSVSPTNGIGGGGRKSPYAIPLVPTADGPAGLRIPLEVGIKTTAFPCATQLACTWDTELVEEVMGALAEEIRENNIGIYLAPAMNIHRDPLCGRNFEYYSEDPLISGKMAAAAVRGIQKNGIAATVKHLACYGKEVNRCYVDSRVSERALREIYLKGFEIAVRESDPWAIMTSYNLLNGVRTSQHYDLITGILRGEWGYDGLVMTDWHVHGSHIREILAGSDVKMPENLLRPENVFYNLREDIAAGRAPRSLAQQSAKRVLQMILKLS